MSAIFPVPAAPLPIWFPAYVSGKAVEEESSALAFATPMGGPDRAPGSCSQPGPTLAVTVIWRVN